MRHKRTTELRYPGLWRGCVCAWAPCLGPTGLTLRDWSGFGNHGTLTNTTAAASWVIASGMTLQLDATDDFVSSSLVFPIGPYAVSWREKITATGVAQGRVQLGLPSGNPFAIARFELGGYDYLAFARWGVGNGLRASGVPSITASVGVWRYFTVTGRSITSTTSTDHKVYCDGVEYSVSASGPFGSLSGSTRIGMNAASQAASAQISNVMVHSRMLSAAEAKLLSARPGIAYELAPRRRASLVVGFNRRRRLLAGA